MIWVSGGILSVAAMAVFVILSAKFFGWEAVKDFAIFLPVIGLFGFVRNVHFRETNVDWRWSAYTGVIGVVAALGYYYFF
jgi:hypothetical protein